MWVAQLGRARPDPTDPNGDVQARVARVHESRVRRPHWQRISPAPGEDKPGRVHPGGGGAGHRTRGRRVDHGEAGPDCGLLSRCWTDPSPPRRSTGQIGGVAALRHRPGGVADQRRIGAAQPVQEPAPPSVAPADLGQPTVEPSSPSARTATSRRSTTKRTASS
jgi:hypothetical protein